MRFSFYSLFPLLLLATAVADTDGPSPAHCLAQSSAKPTKAEKNKRKKTSIHIRSFPLSLHIHRCLQTPIGTNPVGHPVYFCRVHSCVFFNSTFQFFITLANPNPISSGGVIHRLDRCIDGRSAFRAVDIFHVRIPLATAALGLCWVRSKAAAKTSGRQKGEEKWELGGSKSADRPLAPSIHRKRLSVSM